MGACFMQIKLMLCAICSFSTDSTGLFTLRR